MRLSLSDVRELVRASLVEGRGDDIREFVDTLPTDGSVFFHLSDLNKLGVNPRSGYDTPLAVCGYPLVPVIKGQLLLDKLPFASRRKYVHFFRARHPGRVVNLSDLDVQAAHELWKRIAGVNGLEQSEMTPDEFRQVPNTKRVRVNRPGGILWHLLWEIYSGQPVQWAKAFRRASIEGVVDYNGIFHDNEPQQGAFFSGAFVDQIRTLENGDIRERDRRTYSAQLVRKARDLCRQFFMRGKEIDENGQGAAAQMMWEYVTFEREVQQCARDSEGLIEFVSRDESRVDGPDSLFDMFRHMFRSPRDIEELFLIVKPAFEVSGSPNTASTWDDEPEE